MISFFEVKISAENTAQANDILQLLLNKRLVTGGQIIEAPAHFLWKGQINTMPNYCTIWSYTSDKHKSAVINTVSEVSVEEIPMVWFTAIEGNEELLEWIGKTLA